MRLKIDVIATGRTTATTILSQEQVDRIRGSEGRARVPLAITYQGQVFRTSVSIYRGQWMTVVNAQMRAGGLVPGATYTVDIVADADERVVEVPDDLAAALRKAKLTKAFEAQSYTKRKDCVRLIEDAKKPETRARRIEAAITTLQGGS
ncbi:MAG: YdeI/OmpD-associated family protein [Actinomycetales bacterium]|nr:YdeI/OmpD-associated family protein [Actinomycetales bacterium]